MPTDDEATAFDYLDGGVETRIRSRLPQLKGAERRVADYILDHLGPTAGMSISETAEAAGTSTASITRFCRAIGLSGYPALRLELAALAGQERSQGAAWRRSVGDDVQPGDTIEKVLGTLVAADVKVATRTAEQLDVAAVEALVDRILAARRVDVYAAGGSALVAEEFMLKCQRLGLFLNVWRDSHAAIMSAALLTGADLAIGLSHSGETLEVVEAMSTAAEGGAATVAITSFPGSTLGDLSALVLTTTAGELTYGATAYPARNAQMLVLDLVFLRLAQRRHTEAEASLETTALAVRRHNARRLAPPSPRTDARRTP
ncbi:MurR/RpiR family transcriptional regulator [Georgenia faecalis]|uniref:MurR/RpiR family transcriptional regulator n=1 Tax=Georgenia faecalis TaxID=2483799 RepID=A0ABV9D8N3_9MICO|nr:MurR/RpiR family transcriptional regulator [Georgenia faecalis]